MPEKEQKKNSQKCDQEKYFSNVFKFWSKIPLYVKTMKMRFYISSGGPFKQVWGGVPELNVRVHISLKNGSPFSQNPFEEFSALDL